ncbi:MAG TPA: butyrate kinase [Bacteroidota bacterium]
MSTEYSIIALNPGSTSTKVAWFEDSSEMLKETLVHDSAVLSRYKDIWEQYDFRFQIVRSWMQKITAKPSAIVGIGGLLKPVKKGTFRVTKSMLDDARSNVQGAHPSNLGCVMAHDLAQEYQCPAFTVDPVSVDEFSSLARYSGHPLIERKSLSHALNIHAMARRAAKEVGKNLDDSSFVVAHLGGGISVAPVYRGRIVDANDASSDGPFSPERTGGLPLQQFIGLCCSGRFREQELRNLVMGNGGLRAYLGTNSLKDVEDKIDRGDKNAAEVFEAMGYQISKEIGAMATVLEGMVDAIVLTGGMATSIRLVSSVRKRVAHICRILVYPGEDEMLALAQGALRVLRNEEVAMTY